MRQGLLPWAPQPAGPRPSQAGGLYSVQMLLSPQHLVCLLDSRWRNAGESGSRFCRTPSRDAFDLKCNAEVISSDPPPSFPQCDPSSTEPMIYIPHVIPSLTRRDVTQRDKDIAEGRLSSRGGGRLAKREVGGGCGVEQSADIFGSVGRWGRRCCLCVPAEWEGCRCDAGTEKTTSRVISTFVQPHLLPKKIHENILINRLMRDKHSWLSVKANATRSDESHRNILSANWAIISRKNNLLRTLGNCPDPTNQGLAEFDLKRPRWCEILQEKRGPVAEGQGGLHEVLAW